MDKMRLFWGEIHTHTNLSDGEGDPEQNFELARRGLDFWSMTDHAYDSVVFSLDYRKRGEGRKILNDEWPALQRLCRQCEEPGEFIPFLGYEWTHFSQGHHNVYYYDYDQPIRMPSTLQELYAALSGVEAFVIPHHVGYPVGACGKDWSIHDERLSPFVEIFSCHGACEKADTIEPLSAAGSWMGPGATGGSVQEALSRGYRLGIMASSDSHGGHPGSHGLGLMAVYAEELSRRALWEAWRRRRIYGVTGDRIELDFSINGRPMGSVLETGTGAGTGPRRIHVRARGWDPIDEVTVLKNNRPLLRAGGPRREPCRKMGGREVVRFRVEWGWEFYGKGPRGWRGNLEVRNARIVKALPAFRGPTSGKMDSGIDTSPDGCRWFTRTYPTPGRPGDGSEALLFELECTPESRLRLTMDCEGRSRSVELSPAELLRRSDIYFFDDLSGGNGGEKDGSHWRRMDQRGKFKVHRGARLEDLTEEIEFTDAQVEGPCDCYYVRVTQRNGHRAWSSPIWVESLPPSGPVG